MADIYCQRGHEIVEMEVLHSINVARCPECGARTTRYELLAEAPIDPISALVSYPIRVLYNDRSGRPKIIVQYERERPQL